MNVIEKPPQRALARMFHPVRLDEPTRTSLAKGSTYSTIGLAAQGILRFATSLLVGHLAGKTELGVVASAIATAVTLAVLWPTSTGSAASKFLARARGASNTDETMATAAHLRMRAMQTGILLGVVSLPIWVVIDHGSWLSALSVAALTIAYSGYSFTRGIQFGAGQIARATSWDVTSVTIGLAGLVILLVAGVRGPILVLPLIVTYGLYAVAGWPYLAGGRPTRERRHELDLFVVLAAVGSLASTGFLQLSQIAAKLAGGDASAGQYAAALSLATPASLLAGSLSLVLLPSMSEAWGRADLAGFRAQTNNATRALAVVMVGIFGVIMVCSPLIIALIWGSKFSGAEDLLPVLVVAVLATNLGVTSVNALTTRSQWGNALSTGSSILGMGVGAAIWFTVAPKAGLMAVALGYLCGTVVMSAIPIATVWRMDRHKWGLVFGRIALQLIVAGGLIAAEHLAHLPVALEPALAAGFLGVWFLVNRADIRKLPIPGLRKKKAPPTRG